MSRQHGVEAKAVTSDEFARRMRGGDNGGGDPDKEPNVFSRWLRRQARNTIDTQVALLVFFNRQSAQDYARNQPVLRRLGDEFDEIVNRAGVQADIAAIKVLWRYGFARPATMTA